MVPELVNHQDIASPVCHEELQTSAEQQSLFFILFSRLSNPIMSDSKVSDCAEVRGEGGRTGEFSWPDR
jgi:hypothetical protein